MSILDDTMCCERCKHQNRNQCNNFPDATDPKRFVDYQGELTLPCNPGAILEKDYRAKKNPDKLPEAVAIWHLALTVDCPVCDITFDITKKENWYERISSEVGESTRNVADEFTCPNCKTKLLITDYVN